MSSPALAVHPIQVAIVEDDEEIRSDFANRIERCPSFRLVQTYPNAELALLDLPNRRTDVVLMDINLPGMDGVECVRQLKAKMPAVQFLMLTVYEDGDRLFKSLIAGASGYLLKCTPPEKLLTAIHEVHQGGAPMTPEVARRVVQFFQHMPQSPNKMQKITPREKEVLEQLAKGYLYKEIEKNLLMSPGTLRTHIAHIYEKLHVHNRTEAVLKFMEP